MMTSGKIPSSKTVSETAALLNVMGGGSKEAQKLLQQIGEAVTNFEKAKSESREAKLSADKSVENSLTAAEVAKRDTDMLILQREAFRKEMSEKNADLDKREQAVHNSENVVNGKYRDLNNETLESNKNLAVQRNALEQRTVQIDRRETSVSEREAKLRDLVAQLRPLADKLSKVILSARDI